jgi:hypothetical protein
LPDDVQVLHREYPVVLIKEIAEKNIMIDEDIAIPGIEKIVSCIVIPKICRQQVVGDKLSVVGIAQCHLLYNQDDGTLTVRDEEIEFSQVTDVGQVYNSDTCASVMPAVYSLEYEKMEGRVRLKCGIVCQYLIMDRINLDIIEDAYSPVREVTLQGTRCQLPAVLDIKDQNLQTKATLNISGNQIIASNLLMDNPILQRGEDSMKMLLNGGVQVLFKDVAGQLQCSNGKWSVQMELNAANSVDLVCSVPVIRIADIKMNGSAVEILVDIGTQMMSMIGENIPAIVGLSYGELSEPDPARPSLLLMRKGSETIWELAKQNGSTVEAISKVNQLHEDAKNGSILLIPVF